MTKISMTYSPGSDGPCVYRCCDLVIFHEPQATYHLWRAHELYFLTASAVVEALSLIRNGSVREALPVPSDSKEAVPASPHCPTVLDAFLVQCEYSYKPCPYQDALHLLDTFCIPNDAPATEWGASINEAVQRWINREAQ